MARGKKEYLEMGYTQLVSKEIDIDTIYKKFENGNVRIFQFNEDFQKEPIGGVYLSKEQAEKLFN